MFNYRKAGYSIEFDLPDSPVHYTGYYVVCTYKYIKSKEKYSLTMSLKNKQDNAEFRISGRDIDTQLIPGTRDNIEDNIARIVEQAYSTGFFEDYINDYEYTSDCFFKGNEILSVEYNIEDVNCAE